MVEKGFKRKLTAIISADVQGYSRLMDDNEEATVRTLTAYRKAITDLTQQFRGRVIDNPGDNILAEFSSVVDAVDCAVEIQRELSERNAILPEDRRIHFRIGVNQGVILLRKMTEFTATGSISLPAWKPWQKATAFAFKGLPAIS